jgi:hypothetical protein
MLFSAQYCLLSQWYLHWSTEQRMLWFAFVSSIFTTSLPLNILSIHRANISVQGRFDFGMIYRVSKTERSLSNIY